MYPYSTHSTDPQGILKRLFNNLKIFSYGKYDKIPEGLKVNIVEIDESKTGVSIHKLVDIVKSDSSSKIVVFANYYSECANIQKALAENGVKSSMCLNETSIEQRILEYNRFGEKNKVLISNDLAARGLDINANHAILYHLPEIFIS